MHFILGVRTAEIEKYADPVLYCPDNDEHLLEVIIQQQYFHVFFIPFFPIGPTDVWLRCNSCIETYYNPEIEDIYKDPKYHWFLFLGPIIIVGSIVLLGLIAAIVALCSSSSPV
ncbi:hypothetical protein [Chitinophaga sp. Cy-1792]|uniref:hypothetical protein n=1 Tax=Chitinophaga sp. Cy-1792 TaxID=2608339 RepID=UPI00141DFF73|nr:hypothetical protein [Chitinophaga sp. Cy-1792]NIG53566.1 hypothetical protein [Chitinophaga sp. Cy-1792]